MTLISDEEASRFNRTLLEFDELSQTILKGHLMLEGLLDSILEQLLGRGSPIGGALDEARLSFHQKTRLVRAACRDRCPPETWRTLAKLNGLRNQMAHTLDSPKIPSLIDELCKEIHVDPATQPDVRHTKEFQIEMVAIALAFAYGDLRKLNEQLHEKA
jgi:hypothetical protein